MSFNFEMEYPFFSKIRWVWMWCAIWIGSVISVLSSPIIPGLKNPHPLSESAAGVLLIGELGCGACHNLGNQTLFQPKPAPDLTNVGLRLKPAFLMRFLESPSTEQPGTTMPDMLNRFSPAERKKAALALTHFLMRQREGDVTYVESDLSSEANGKNLYTSVGCVVCHGLDSRASTVENSGVIPLNHVSSKYDRGSLAAFLFQPLKFRPGGRMPDMKLSQEEASSIARYLISNETKSGNVFEMNENLALQGRGYFEELNCHACHPLKGMSPGRQVKPILGDPGDAGCLMGATEGFNGASYRLSSNQRQSIRAALESKADVGVELDPVKLAMTRFNCLACHERDGYGGVPASDEDLFLTDQPELGREGRIPPDLSKLGAMLKPEVIRKVLFDAVSYRPYMRTRMPQFGEDNLPFFVEAVLREDSVAPMVFEDAPQDEQRRAREAGHLLVGDKGLNCIACHNVNGIESPGFKGIDLMASYERLQPGWFYRYLLDPNEYRPGIIMPAYWPGGQPVLENVLDGDANAQIKAIWHYLSLGTSAQTPSGMRREASKLFAQDHVRVYRGRSHVAGFRGIAVGFPGGVNYAFDAQNGSLAALWKGDFVTANWSGQGAGDFNPLAQPIQLNRDLAFFRLQADSESWPARPIPTKENPVNPDPDYPRNHGYRFKGYSLDLEGAPTFRYRAGNIEIEDRSIGILKNGKARLIRTFVFDSIKKDRIDFRALAGDLEQESSNHYRTENLSLWFDDCETLLRAFMNGKASHELILRIPILEGRSTFTVSYEFQ